MGNLMFNKRKYEDPNLNTDEFSGTSQQKQYMSTASDIRRTHDTNNVSRTQVDDYSRVRTRGSSCTPPHFSKTPLPLVMLVSYPGAGNTWTRHLIQQATGSI